MELLTDAHFWVGAAFVVLATWESLPGFLVAMSVLGLGSGLLDVAPGTRFPAHHHGGDEECYVISGSLVACGRRIGAGDFHHADAGSDRSSTRTHATARPRSAARAARAPPP